jgi:flagellar L-ring protein precursor FlgH
MRTLPLLSSPAAKAGLRLAAGVLLLAAVAQLTGCATAPPAQLTHSTDFGPVYPVASDEARVPTGAIYNGRQSDQWFGRGRNLRVGDIVTVLLDEATQGERTQSANLSRKGTNDVLTSGLTQKLVGRSSVFGGINLNEAEITSGGSGDIGQGATLKGEISVTVVEVLANGNLVVRGEKQMALSEGTEVIQVSGIIRPDDISRNNTIRSRRLTNAQFIYRGTGDIANASRAGWGTRALLKFWPF